MFDPSEKNIIFFTATHAKSEMQGDKSEHCFCGVIDMQIFCMTTEQCASL